MALIRAMQEDYGIEFIQGWGMTETSPVAALGVPPADMPAPSPEAVYEIKSKAGRPPFGVELKIVDDSGVRLAHDGERAGELLVRAHRGAVRRGPDHAVRRLRVSRANRGRGARSSNRSAGRRQSPRSARSR